MISIVTTGRCAPVAPLAKAWAPTFDNDPAVPASDGLSCANDCPEDDCWPPVAVFPDPGDDAPLSLLELL